MRTPSVDGELIIATNVPGWAMELVVFNKSVGVAANIRLSREEMLKVQSSISEVLKKGVT
jgi:hypothetical protein